MRRLPDRPSRRPRSEEHAQLERDVEAFLLRGGSITHCAIGLTTVPEIASLRELVQDEFDVARARARVRRTRERGHRRSVAASRVRRGG